MNEMNMTFRADLPTPEDLKEQFPLPQKLIQLKKRRDKEVRDIFQGKNNRLLLIIGPCSADREDAVIDYVSRLSKVQDKVKDRVLIIPRLYTNKPRTVGIGYKGILHQPDPEKGSDLLKGVITVRKLNLNVISQTGLTCADEMLYPDNQQFFSDLHSYIAVGARSVEDQLHRMTASGFNIPVGMKNPTSGNLTVMLNSIVAVQAKQDFIYRNSEVTTKGNPLAHAILRGYETKTGTCRPNYHYEDLQLLLSLYYERNIAHPAAIIDCNHANSNKHYLDQIRISRDVLYSRKQSADIRKLIKGLMIESYIEDGCQTPHEHEYGKSITDPCLGWKKTEKLIYELAETWE